jgi:hypothetical protein
MPTDSEHLVRSLGEIIRAREAMTIADSATKTALDLACRAAGDAVSQTINRTDPAAIARARELIDECRSLIELLNGHRIKASEVMAESQRLSQRSIDLVQDIRNVTDEIKRRRRRQN